MSCETRVERMRAGSSRRNIPLAQLGMGRGRQAAQRAGVAREHCPHCRVLLPARLCGPCNNMQGEASPWGTRIHIGVPGMRSLFWGTRIPYWGTWHGILPHPLTLPPAAAHWHPHRKPEYSCWLLASARPSPADAGHLGNKRAWKIPPPLEI